ncbi:hypothetical protein ATY41_01720 [Leifsonia xyli subsp. xyli]|uniref:DUF4440 domain-containing protein n=1 Tax=Leifsonia xyli subsp. xyli TaxID=59736 RepID=A0A1E2SKU5_LEIXY|nr:nuclear transport factor 2 family protein [Leifsonia xyli]ODA90379.1 hypothetical protein ATY41_01720 [Leifsonia xyli subsp. xyli]
MASTVTDLAALHPAWAERFNAADLPGMLALYESDAVFLPQPGVPVTGTGLGDALQEFIDLSVPVRVTVRHTAQVGELGLTAPGVTVTGGSTARVRTARA